MKLALQKVGLFVAFALILTHCPAFASDAVVDGIQGEVLVARAAAPTEWQAVTTDTPLKSGDLVKTRSGSCVLHYGDQGTFALDANTQVSVQDLPSTQDIKLELGKIRGKVNKEKTLKPFQVVTPVAVAAIRGTEVDFGFNDKGELTADLHNGQIQVVNDEASLNLDLGGKKTITLKYDKQANTFTVKNDCASDGPVSFSLLGVEYAVNPCDEQTADLSTGEGQNGPPGTNTQNDPENPDEGREPISPNQP